MNKEKECLLSVTMIVKDEEHNIRRALESIKKVVDEIIIIDTGSKDKTPEIVKEYTDKVYFHEWKNDFSEARNYSLKFPTCEWVLILDADEELSEEFKKNIRRTLRKLSDDINTIFVPTVSFLDFEKKKKDIAVMPRIFRNGTVYYKNIVHNHPVFKQKVTFIPYRILHYGYIWTRKLRKKKYERTANLIRKHLKNSKNIHDKLYYLSQLYKTEATVNNVVKKNQLVLEILDLLKSTTSIPSIVPEILYYFGMDLINHGFLNRAKNIFNEAIKMDPSYPDPYFGLLYYYYITDKWYEVLSYVEKFLLTLNEALSATESASKWSVTSLKFTGAACIIASLALLRLGKGAEAKRWFLKGIKYSEENGEDLKNYLRSVIRALKDIPCDVVRDFVDVRIVEKLHEWKISLTNVLKKIIECNVKIFLDLNIGDFYKELDKLLYKKISIGSEEFLEALLGKEGFTVNDIVELVRKYGIASLLFLYDYMVEMNYNEKEKLGVLSSIRKLVEDDNVKAVALALLGDEYLKKGRFQEAIAMYKKSIEFDNEIIPFVKPVIEDMKIFLTTDLEGSFEEIYRYFSKNKELIFDVSKILDKETLQVLYLLSDSDYAKYVSALSIDDPDKSIEILNGIKNKEKFPFYYYRIAKMYEKKKEWEKAFEMHLKACHENENLADIRHGVYKYHALYFEDEVPFDGEEVVWSGNISETFSNFDVISPVRLWKKSKEGIYYSIPFHSKDSVEIFVKKFFETKNSLSRVFSFDSNYVWRYMVKENIKSFEVIKSFFVRPEDIEIRVKKFSLQEGERSNILVVPEGLEITLPKDFENIVHKYKRVILIFFEPSKEESLVWRFPPFKIIRPIHYLREFFGKRGYVLKNYEKIGRDVFIADFMRSGV